jgi:translation initiation factor 2B subunit (eIF-2B alpha/beta/delta family)
VRVSVHRVILTMSSSSWVKKVITPKYNLKKYVTQTCP